MDVRRALLYAIVLHVSSCGPQAEFDQFPGFDSVYNDKETTTLRLSNRVTTTFTNQTTTSTMATTKEYHLHNTIKKIEMPTINLTRSTTTPNLALPYVCPEEDVPANIGAYEVPTQKDLTIHIKKTLKDKFRKYHEKVLYFLNDIKEVTKATTSVASRCSVQNRWTYKKCVKFVSNQCQTITKNLATSLELQRHDVKAFTESSICNFSSMKADPVQLIKVLAMEEASLDFALSGFLRLMSACERYCSYRFNSVSHKKPLRHMSDQDLIIKHLLTRKSYVQLIKGT